MRRCYAELGRPAGVPLAAFDDAFKRSTASCCSVVQGERKPWAIDFPDLPDLGGGATVLGLLNRLIGWLGGHVRKVQPLAAQPLAPFHTSAAAGDRARSRWCWERPTFFQPITCSTSRTASRRAFGRCRAAIRCLPSSRTRSRWAEAPGEHNVRLPEGPVARGRLLQAPVDLLYLGVTFTPGCLTTGSTSAASTPSKGSRCAHGSRSIRPSPEAATRRRRTGSHSTANMQAFYDASFSYVDGDADEPNVAASVALRCMFASCSITKGRSF